MKVRYVAAGAGPAVVLVHGLGATLSVWNENVPALAQDHAVYAMDLPGHGWSDKPDDIAYDPVSGARFLVRFMDALGIPRATLVGNSGGGLIAALCALDYPERVDRLVLVDPAGLGRSISGFLHASSVPVLGEVINTPLIVRRRNLVKSIFYEYRPAMGGVVDEVMEVRNLPETKRAVLKAVRATIGVGGVRRGLLVLDRLATLRRPPLIIWGREDRIIPVDHASRAARVLPHARVHVIDRCGHWPQLERPEEFNAVVLDV